MSRQNNGQNARWMVINLLVWAAFVLVMADLAKHIFKYDPTFIVMVACIWLSVATVVFLFWLFGRARHRNIGG